MKTKRCCVCNKTKSREEFYKNNRAKDGLASRCKRCQDGYHEEWRKNPQNLETARKRARDHYDKDRLAKRKYSVMSQTNHKRRALDLLGGCCQLCGEDHPATLQFHHRDPSTKLFNLSTKTIAQTRKFPWEMIEAEVAKCDLLCGNCHAKHHSLLTSVNGQWVVDDDKIKDITCL